LAQKIKYVALYVRKSRDNKESLEGQLSSLIDYCERFNWEYEVFPEKGSSSSENWNRPELQKMIKRIAKQHFDAVVVTEQSRITRSDEFPKFRNILQETNCFFITTQTNSIYDYNKPEDEFVSDIMSAVNKQEIAFAKLRLKRGTIQKAKKGNWLGKKSPVGYKYNKETKHLETTADSLIIKNLFKLYEEGMSTKEIAEKFVSENVNTSTGIIWTPQGISRILNNIVYVGHSLYGKTTEKKDKKTGKRTIIKTSKEEQIFVKNTHSAIVSQEEWDKVQKIKQLRNSRPIPLKLGKRKFSGLIRCGRCGKIHSFQASRGNKQRISSCQTRNYNSSHTSYSMCGNRGCNLDLFEQVFYSHFKKYVDKLEQYRNLIRESNHSQEIDYQQEIDSKEKQVKKIQSDIKRVQQGFIMEIFTQEEAHKQISGFKNRIKIIQDEISSLQTKDEHSELDIIEIKLSQLRKIFNNNSEISEREINEILKEFIETIIYIRTDDNKIQLDIVYK
jgi:DNA invertase Pin-like site-specific DNA recombinase